MALLFILRSMHNRTQLALRSAYSLHMPSSSQHATYPGAVGWPSPRNLGPGIVVGGGLGTCALKTIHVTHRQESHAHRLVVPGIPHSHTHPGSPWRLSITKPWSSTIAVANGASMFLYGQSSTSRRPATSFAIKMRRSWSAGAKSALLRWDAMTLARPPAH